MLLLISVVLPVKFRFSVHCSLFNVLRNVHKHCSCSFFNDLSCSLLTVLSVHTVHWSLYNVHFSLSVLITYNFLCTWDFPSLILRSEALFTFCSLSSVLTALWYSLFPVKFPVCFFLFTVLFLVDYLLFSNIFLHSFFIFKDFFLICQLHRCIYRAVPMLFLFLRFF